MRRNRRISPLASFGIALPFAVISLLGITGCGSDKKPIDIVTSDPISSNAENTNVVTQDSSAPDVPTSLVALIKKNTGVDDSIGECVGGNLIDAYGIEKASKIAALPTADPSDDRVVLDQAVLDCRG